MRANAALGGVIVRERLARGGRFRIPEPMVMAEGDGVVAFHVEHPVLQLPTYEVCSSAMSRLLPEGGKVLDLGSGSGRLVARLAKARPDIEVVGTDLSGEMLAEGRRLVAEEGLEDRVELRRLDMTRADEVDLEQVDLVSSVWALHHLPAHEQLVACLRGVAALRERFGCAVFLFDFARLRRAGSFPALLTLAPDAPERLRADGIASERAAWSTAELSAALAEAGLGALGGGPERVIGHFQVWHAPAEGGRPSAHDRRWVDQPLPAVSRRLAARLGRTMPLPRDLSRLT